MSGYLGILWFRIFTDRSLITNYLYRERFPKRKKNQIFQEEFVLKVNIKKTKQLRRFVSPKPSDSTALCPM